MIAAELGAGGDVAIAGFGKFSVRERAAHEGRNPATGKTIQIAASRAVKFSPAAALKTQLNSSTGRQVRASIAPVVRRR